MKPVLPLILTINGGSSSLKFARFEAGDPLPRILDGAIERIGLPETTLRVKGLNQADNLARSVTAPDHTVAVGGLDTLVFAGGIGEHAPRSGPGFARDWGSLAANAKKRGTRCMKARFPRRPAGLRSASCIRTKNAGWPRWFAAFWALADVTIPFPIFQSSRVTDYLPAPVQGNRTRLTRTWGAFGDPGNGSIVALIRRQDLSRCEAMVDT
jgi:hypothetical protein